MTHKNLGLCKQFKEAAKYLKWIIKIIAIR